ncbi:MAG: calcium/sodium antiporter [Prevotella sp.]|nr:calcium/sodium antiporter [Prevotella sp.]
MLLDCLLIILGVAMVLYGADRLTEGAASLARRMNVSEMVIGLTIVAAGTSAPELFVSVVSALNGTPDLAVGNVVGSNIMNTLLIVGVSAMVMPIVVTRPAVYKDMPFTAGATLLLAMLCVDGQFGLSLKGHIISRMDGTLLLAAFALFMIYTFAVTRKSAGNIESSETAVSPVWKSLLFVVLGLTLLIVGSNFFVDSATSVAETLGVSQSVIGLTIVAGGTSLPELATSVVAARKGQSALAIGNVIGSNVFNILLILGLTSVICPMQIEGITIIDMATMLVSVVLLWLFSFTKFKVERWEGTVLTLGYAAYLCWLLYNI